MPADPPAEAVASLPELKQATVSPDGERVAFYYTGTGRNELHVLDPRTGDVEQWTDGDAPDANVWPVAWSADGDRVYVQRDDGDGDEAYAVYAVGPDGVEEAVADTPGTTKLRDVGADGETLLVASTHDGSMDAYAVDLQEGGLTRVTDVDHAVWTALLAPDGRRVAIPHDGDVRLCPVGDGDPRDLDVGPGDSSTAPVDWGPAGDRLLVSDDADGAGRSGVYDVETGDVRWFGSSDRVEDPQQFLAGGDRFVATRDRDAMRVPVVYDVRSGESRELDVPDGVSRFGLKANRVLDADRLLLTHSTPRRPHELAVYDLATDDYERVFTPDTGPFDPGDFVAPEYERVPSDGVPETPAEAVDHDPCETLDVGTLFYDCGRRPSPLVVFPHGGPNLADRREFDSRVQFLCRRGYSVLRVNYRGSAGRGRAYERALRGDWGGAEQGDVATAVEHVLDAHDWLDDDAVAVYGGSYGGYSACWQLVQYPGLYDAVASVVGMTDLRDAYEGTAPEFQEGFFDVYLGSPDENPGLYEERSPVTHAEHADAPVLLVHGENDPRVPVSQARRFRDALLDAGYEADDLEYHELAESGHWSHGGGVPEPLALVEDFLDRRL
ncbi:MAG: alpha/beta fold hydrolase [Halobacterium sp.]